MRCDIIEKLLDVLVLCCTPIVTFYLNGHCAYIISHSFFLFLLNVLAGFCSRLRATTETDYCCGKQH